MIFQRFFKVKIVRINTKSQADVQVWVSLFREFFKQITFLLWVKERFTLEKEQIAHGPTFLKSNGRDSLKIELLDRVTRANGSLCFLKKGDGAKSDRSDPLLGKTVEKQWKTVKNLKKYDFFERIARFWERFARITSESLMTLFLKSNASKSLTVALKNEWFWAKERIPNSAEMEQCSNFSQFHVSFKKSTSQLVFKSRLTFAEIYFMHLPFP